MSDKQPAEFGENGAVVNTPHMTPARRDSYSGIQSDTQDNLVEYKWWAHMPGVFVTVIGTMSISRFDENISIKRVEPKLILLENNLNDKLNV